ncbi:RNA polymerase sigma factor sigB [Dendrobium catenatum]|uniref:RNA polymerase sigma factor n=1 Tax=Dendrobium catenatum TaxID=906689 RepID=A0A2I0W6C9_9ASPA|nr:RNA polymerase sigma factor sigB [Dendrobium catenatum]PKU71214.1 RNA polymerase sigma factor sigB [Dendrobium catenatum]
MAFLLPQLKCPVASLDARLRSPHYTLHLNARVLVHFKTHCSSSQIMTVIEKLHIPTLEGHFKPLGSTKPLTYIGVVGPPGKRKGEETLPKEAFLTSDEAVIAAAAAEAVAIAKAAVEVAKEAAQLLESDLCLKLDKSNDSASGDEKFRYEVIKLSDIEQTRHNHSATTVTEPLEGHITKNLSQDTSISDFMRNELDLMQNIAVRSKRQVERRARRARLTETAIAPFASVKSGSSGKKKRAALQEVDYSDPLHYLRNTTSSAKLLTSAEEQEFSEGIQDLLKLERIQEELVERFGRQPTSAEWAVAAGLDTKTLRQRLNYGTHCKDKMIKSNIRLVISIAKNFQGAGMSIQDLVQEGCRGLLRGAEKFDASKGFKFSTYAHWWIKQSVRKSLSDQSRTIRLPFHMVEASYRVREARKQLYIENGKHPDNEKVAEAAGLTMKRFTAVMLAPKAPISLDQKIGINESLKPSEIVSDPEALTPEEILVKQFMKEDLNKTLDCLNQREQKVVRWRFGMEDGRMKTLQEIGELMGVSRERIRQIESCAFRKLKTKKRTKNLRQYMYL